MSLAKLRQFLNEAVSNNEMSEDDFKMNDDTGDNKPEESDTEKTDNDMSEDDFNIKLDDDPEKSPDDNETENDEESETDDSESDESTDTDSEPDEESTDDGVKDINIKILKLSEANRANIKYDYYNKFITLTNVCANLYRKVDYLYDNGLEENVDIILKEISTNKTNIEEYINFKFEKESLENIIDFYAICSSYIDELIEKTSNLIKSN